MLPLMSVLYGYAMPMLSYHSGRPVEMVNFSAKVSQGCSTGSAIAPLSLHFAAHLALQTFPQEHVQKCALQENYNFIWPVRVVEALFAAFQKTCHLSLQVTVNMEKSSLLLSQANTIISPRASLSMDTFLRAIPELKELKVSN